MKIKVMWWVPANDLGTEQPWIPEADECEFEMERHEVDRDGNLTLFDSNNIAVAFFAAGKWAMGGPIIERNVPTP